MRWFPVLGWLGRNTRKSPLLVPSLHMCTQSKTSTHTEGSMNTAHTSLDNLCLSPLSLGILSPMSTFIHLSTVEAAFLLADSTQMWKWTCSPPPSQTYGSLSLCLPPDSTHYSARPQFSLPWPLWSGYWDTIPLKSTA